MTGAKHGLTLDEHREIGARLKVARDELTSLVVQLSAAYRNGAAPVRLALRAANAIDRLRGDLDGACAREHPDAFTPGIYYPGNGRHAP